jgi:hypothetical protein
MPGIGRIELGNNLVATDLSGNKSAKIILEPGLLSCLDRHGLPTIEGERLICAN